MMNECETIRLRGHHWLCLRYFRGEGYSDGFVENLERIMSRLGKEAAGVVEGADSVCAACCHLSDGRCAHPASGDEQIRAIDTLALDLLGYRVGEERMLWEADISMAGMARWRASACDGCVWADRCEA